MLEVFIALIFVSNFLLLLLMCSLFSSERAMSESDDHKAAVTDDQANDHVNESAEAESKSNERFLIEILYEDRVKQWFVPVISDILDIDIDEFRDRITKLFGLPRASELVLSYFDKDGLMITITDDNHLQEIMMQNMDHGKVYVRSINNATIKQVGGGGARQKPIYTLKATNPSAPPESDFDDWLIT